MRNTIQRCTKVHIQTRTTFAPDQHFIQQGRATISTRSIHIPNTIRRMGDQINGTDRRVDPEIQTGYQTVPCSSSKTTKKACDRHQEILRHNFQSRNKVPATVHQHDGNTNKLTCTTNPLDPRYRRNSPHAKRVRNRKPNGNQSKCKPKN